MCTQSGDSRHTQAHGILLNSAGSCVYIFSQGKSEIHQQVKIQCGISSKLGQQGGKAELCEARHSPEQTRAPAASQGQGLGFLTTILSISLGMPAGKKENRLSRE